MLFGTVDGASASIVLNSTVLVLTTPRAAWFRLRFFESDLPICQLPNRLIALVVRLCVCIFFYFFFLYIMSLCVVSFSFVLISAAACMGTELFFKIGYIFSKIAYVLEKYL